jgi:hypothetical protein
VSLKSFYYTPNDTFNKEYIYYKFKFSNYCNNKTPTKIFPRGVCFFVISWTSRRSLGPYPFFGRNGFFVDVLEGGDGVFSELRLPVGRLIRKADGHGALYGVALSGSFDRNF